MRTFAVVTITDVQPLVNAAGAAVIERSRKSLDGTQMILTLNHHRPTIDALFLEGVDVDALLAGLSPMTEAEATALSLTTAWLSEEVI